MAAIKTFEILSRQKAKRKSFSLKDSTAIVSISDSREAPNKFARSPFLKGVCHVFFDDICIPSNREMLMTDTDAEKIKEFIDDYWDKVNHLIICCHAGISRSSGCMSGILQAKGIDDRWIWRDERFCPNVHVVNKIREAYKNAADNCQIDAKTPWL